ncbi:hypothetical protein HY994_03530 [Candidatus Micrarchaeota archaeon]|nr:hypothetical protein [Candidatus Micrarchaeota archaeon]
MRYGFWLVLVALSPLVFAGYTLNVITQGGGFVSSVPSGILCGAACMETYDAGTLIILTAMSQSGAFQGWSGACSGTQTVCTVNMDGPKLLTATFAGQTYAEYELTVVKSGDGAGTVSSDPFGITLGQIAPYDSAKFTAASQITLTASPQSGSRFDGWSGACSGTQPTCIVKMDAAQSVTATFSNSGSPTPASTPPATATIAPSTSPIPSNSPVATLLPSPKPTAGAAPTPLPQFELSIAKTGAGRGAAYVWPSGRLQQLCGSSEAKCSWTYPAGTTFSFQVIPRPDSQFQGWTGNCQGMACEITLDGPKKLTASFGLIETKSQNPQIVPIPPSGEPPVPTPPYIPRATPRPAQDGEYPLYVQINGKGTVAFPENKVVCSGYCGRNYARSSVVTLTARPETGWKFVGWGGSCINAQGPECTVTIDGSSLFISSTTVRAVFEPTLKTLAVSMTGDGSVRSSDNRIFCSTSGRIAYICAGGYPFQTTVELTAQASGESTFDRWEGACTNAQPHCSVSMDGDKTARAVFRGPPIDKTLTLSMPKEKGGAIYVMTAGPGVRIPLKECDSECSYKFKHGEKIEIEVKTYNGFQMEGYLGSCIGSGTCHLTMDADRTVAVPFYKVVTRKLTVIKPRLGTVISQNVDGIRCGPVDDRCVVNIDTRKLPILKFEGVEGDYGLFESGCTNIVKKIHSRYGLYEECNLDMAQDRTVRTKSSPEQEKHLVGMAMGWAFGRTDYPGLVEFATAEYGVPFQYALAAFRSGKGGNTALGMEKWIKDNWDAILKDTGTGQFMLDYDTDVVRQGLRKTFNPDIEAYKSKPWFKAEAAYQYAIQDTARKPFIRGYRDWQYFHRKSVAEFESHLINQKQSYYRNEGIEPFFQEPPKPTPSPKPRGAPELVELRADSDQIGKPVTITGRNLADVSGIRIDGNAVDMQRVDDEHIRLPTVRWGISPDFGMTSVLTFQIPDGRTAYMIQAHHIHPTTRNANGKEEECFGGVGPGCKGTAGKDFSGKGATNVGKRIGCLAEENGARVCYTSAGSLRHDNCCVWNPAGKWCGGPGTDGNPAEENNHNGKCVQEWHEAFWDSFWERTWTQSYRMSVAPDLSPYPSPFQRYFTLEAKGTTTLCAPAGTELRESKDAAFCCSGRLDYWKKCQ